MVERGEASAISIGYRVTDWKIHHADGNEIDPADHFRSADDIWFSRSTTMGTTNFFVSLLADDRSLDPVQVSSPIRRRGDRQRAQRHDRVRENPTADG